MTFIKTDEYESMTALELKDYIYNRYNIVCQLDQNGKILQYFFSPNDAAKSTSTSLEVLYRALRNEVKHANHFQWCYYKDLHTKLNKKIFNFGNELAVGKIIDDKIVEIYQSAKKAAKANNCDSSGIVKVCKGKRKTCGGFQWGYITEE